VFSHLSSWEKVAVLKWDSHLTPRPVDITPLHNQLYSIQSSWKNHLRRSVLKMVYFGHFHTFSCITHSIWELYRSGKLVKIFWMGDPINASYIAITAEESISWFIWCKSLFFSAITLCKFDKCTCFSIHHIYLEWNPPVWQRIFCVRSVNAIFRYQTNCVRRIFCTHRPLLGQWGRRLFAEYANASRSVGPLLELTMLGLRDKWPRWWREWKPHS
jgi:hypothetical protein